MGLLSALLDSYNYAMDHGMVGKPDQYGHVILPMYYNSMKSDGKNIINLIITREGKLIEHNWMPKGEVILFPVTEDSSARSSGVAPHPLVDNASYLLRDGSPRSEVYMEQLEEWLAYEDNDFVRIIRDFIKDGKALQNVFEGLMPEPIDEKIKKENPKKAKKLEEDREKKINDLYKIFFTFSIAGYRDLKNVSVSENIDLQKRFREYVNFLNEQDPDRKKITCNLSGELDYLCVKHQPLVGRARLVSQIEASEENWKGRFTRANQNIALGVETSQKIHLMAKYLLSGENTRRWLGEQVNMVSWFSDDICNESGVDVAKTIETSNIGLGVLPKERKTSSVGRSIADEVTENILQSFTAGRPKFSDDANYYIAIFDKVSNGRVAAKYFKSLSVSRLKENLVNWQKKYHWRGYGKENSDKDFTPSPRRIVLAAYGTEREGGLEISKKTFLTSQYQSILAALVEGRDIPSNFERALAMNIRNRNRYDKTWMEVKFCALAILKHKGGFEKAMLNRENTDRSYLFGRLLAIFERIEASTFDKESDRTTNAEKMWTSYTNHPATMMMRLRDLLKPYERKLQADEMKRGIYFKLKKDMTEVTNLLDDHYDFTNSEVNRPLDYGFIFGYEGQMRDIFTKKHQEDESAISEEAQNDQQ